MSANNNRRLKGLAVDKLTSMGFTDVYASDSGENIIIITDTPEKLRTLTIDLIGTLAYRNKSKADFFLKLNKTNCKILAINYNPQ